MNRTYTLLLILSFVSLNSILSQQVIHHQFSLIWSETLPLKFEGAGEYANDPRLPVYTYRFPIGSKSTIEPHLSITSSELITLDPKEEGLEVPRSYILGAVAENERGRWYARVWLMPLVAAGQGKAQKIISGEITLTLKNVPSPVTPRSGPGFKETSILSSGTIHRISVEKSGVYKIDYNFIKDKINVDPATISPDKFAIYGNGAGRMPQWNGALRIDDHEESRTRAVGMEDGKIDQGDYFLWYAQGADQWTFDPQERIYHMDKNTYDESNHYYIIINGPSRNAITSRNNSGNGNYESNTSLIYQRLEDEKVNLLGRFRTPGSGQEWYGDELSAIPEIDYSSRFDLGGIMPHD